MVENNKSGLEWESQLTYDRYVQQDFYSPQSFNNNTKINLIVEFGIKERDIFFVPVHL